MALHPLHSLWHTMYVVRSELMRPESRGSWGNIIALLGTSLPFVNELDIMAKLGITSTKEFRSSLRGGDAGSDEWRIRFGTYLVHVHVLKEVSCVS